MKPTTQGAAMLLLCVLLASLTVLLNGLYIRTSYLMRTVIEREQCIKRHSGLEALACNAIALAKEQWGVLMHAIAHAQITCRVDQWPIDDTHVLQGSICYKKAVHNKKDVIHIEVTLSQEGTACGTLCCIIQPYGKDMSVTVPDMVQKVEIIEWKLQ